MRVLIQHHPSRASLLQRIQGPLPQAEVVPDPEPNGVRHPWRAYRASLAHAAETGGLIIQDDSVPAEGLSDVLDQIGMRWPDKLVLLWVGSYPRPIRMAYSWAVHDGARYVEAYPATWVPLIAVIWPQHLAADCLAWADRRPQSNQRRATADDGVVGQWLMRHRMCAVATVPSLVEHPDDAGSLMSVRLPAPRTAIMVADDARGYDWG